MARKNVTCNNYMKLTQKEKGIMYHAIWLHLLLLVCEPEGGSASTNKQNTLLPFSNQCFFRAPPFSVTWEDMYLKLCRRLPINGYYYMFLVKEISLASSGHRPGPRLWERRKESMKSKKARSVFLSGSFSNKLFYQSFYSTIWRVKLDSIH